MNEARPKRKRRSCCLLLVLVLLVSTVGLGVLAVFVVRSSYADLYRFRARSMDPTLLTGDVLLLDRDAYGTRVPFTAVVPGGQRMPTPGDLVAVHLPVDDKTYIRRVVGVPGDTVSVRHGLLRIGDDFVEVTSGQTTTGILYPATYDISLASGEGVDQERLTVAEGRVFVLGDNRGNAADSRTWGQLPLANVEAGVQAIVWREGQGPMWEPAP
jgi:signal peptidase I